jgi:hypothetical protein
LSKPSVARVLVLTLTVLVSVALSTSAQGKKSPKDTPVSSILHDSGDVTLSTNNRLQSDGFGIYVHGVGGVQTQIQGIGDWYLDTNGTSRKVLVDLRDAVPDSGANPPFNWQMVTARLISKCTDTGNGTFRTMVGLDSELNCPLAVTWDLSGVTYRLTMNPNNFAETNYVRVTCTGVVDPANPTTSACNRWRITPITQADSQVRSIGRLNRIQTVKGKTTTTNLGNFYVTLDFEIATL